MDPVEADRSPVALVRRAVGPLLAEALERVEDAEPGIVMLAAVPGSGVDEGGVRELAIAVQALRGLIEAVQHTPEHQAAARPAAARRELGLRDVIRQVISGRTGAPFSPRGIYDALDTMPDFDASLYPDLHKAVQNALADMARTGEIHKEGRGRYQAGPARRAKPQSGRSSESSAAGTTGSAVPIIEEEADATHEPSETAATQTFG